MLGILIVESSAAVLMLWRYKHRDTKLWVCLIVTLFLIGYFSVALTHTAL